MERVSGSQRKNKLRGEQSERPAEKRLPGARAKKRNRGHAADRQRHDQREGKPSSRITSGFTALCAVESGSS